MDLKENDIPTEEEYKIMVDADIRKMKKFQKKFSKGLKKEIKINFKADHFDFKIIEETWLFIFKVQQGMYQGQEHTIRMKLVYGQHPYKKIYPLNAPLCSFISPIWHPNISIKGTICLDILKDKWSPCMKTANIIQAIQLLLEFPDSSSPMNKEAAEQFENNPDDYAKKIVEYFRKPL